MTVNDVLQSQACAAACELFRPPSTTPSTSSSPDASSASPDLRRAVTVEGDRAVFSKILQIATSAVRFLWMAEGVTSGDDLTCLYTSLVSFAIEHDWGRIHRSAVQKSTHCSESGSSSLPCLRGDQCREQRSLWPAPRPVWFVLHCTDVHLVSELVLSSLRPCDHLCCDLVLHDSARSANVEGKVAYQPVHLVPNTVREVFSQCSSLIRSSVPPGRRGHRAPMASLICLVLGG